MFNSTAVDEHSCTLAARIAQINSPGTHAQRMYEPPKSRTVTELCVRASVNDRAPASWILLSGEFDHIIANSQPGRTSRYSATRTARARYRHAEQPRWHTNELDKNRLVTWLRGKASAKASAPASWNLLSEQEQRSTLRKSMVKQTHTNAHTISQAGVLASWPPFVDLARHLARGAATQVRAREEHFASSTSKEHVAHAHVHARRTHMHMHVACAHAHAYELFKLKLMIRLRGRASASARAPASRI